jgi:hypothetical protein
MMWLCALLVVITLLQGAALWVLWRIARPMLILNRQARADETQAIIVGRTKGERMFYAMALGAWANFTPWQREQFRRLTERVPA